MAMLAGPLDGLGWCQQYAAGGQVDGQVRPYDYLADGVPPFHGGRMGSGGRESIPLGVRLAVAPLGLLAADDRTGLGGLHQEQGFLLEHGDAGLGLGVELGERF